ncbi:MAG TPA: GAF domain-containing protein, partial [Propionibacteriaceae bacterium]|nr:GAF domain-containing protein [Propionibacteriaceae bacterium]
MFEQVSGKETFPGWQLESLDTLTRVANDLAGEFRLEPLLELILRSSVGLLGCESGSLCLVNPDTNSYRKEVDMEAGCQAGKEFPLSEGTTGAIYRSGAPVHFRHYWEVPGGHLSPRSELYGRAVLGVPIRLRSDLIGSLIVFAADDEREFIDADAQLLHLFATHAAIAMANSRLHAEAADRAKTAAVWAERERSMLDIHDTVERGLATVILQLEHAEALTRDGRGADVALGSARQAAETLLKDGRRAVWALSEEFEGRPVAEGLKRELEWAHATAGVTTTFRMFGDARPIAPEVRAQLVRIVKESLTNVAKHAQAGAVRLGLVYGDEGLAVIVEDDGCGFNVAEASAAGVGLSSLVARATQVGGRVQLDSTLGWGTRIRADLPYRSLPDELAATPRHRVIVIHDQPTVRAGIVRLLDRSGPGVQ